ncbi:MAG: AAA family ATPase [Anaerolineaceae bacterium]|nr:AAA family ATPase [Anaerolineaceae bacterium]
MAEETQGITKITVGGYKSILKETPIEIRPLTILAGTNSSGKSSIMQPMLMMKQTLDATYDPGPLLINGPNIRFTRFEQIKPLAQRESDSFLVTELEYGHVVKLKSSFSFTESDNRNRSIRLSKMSVKSRRSSFDISPGMESEAIEKQVPKVFLESMVDTFVDREEMRDFEWQIIEERCFLQMVMSISGDDITYNFPVSPFFDPVPMFEAQIGNVIHVPGLRGNLQRTYPLPPVQGPRYPGHFHNYAGSLLLRWREEEHKNFSLVERDLNRIGLTKRINPERVDDANVEIQVGRLPVGAKKARKDDLVSIADVGVGVSQILPVIVALIAAQPGQLVYIEQPEMHLHPKAQVALASVLADAAKRGVRVVVETHSALLLQGVQTLIALDKLDNEDVMLHWFERDDEGYSKVDSVKPDVDGAYGEWKEDFGKTELEVMGEYLRAVGERDAVPETA